MKSLKEFKVGTCEVFCYLDKEVCPSEDSICKIVHWTNFPIGKKIQKFNGFLFQRMYPHCAITKKLYLSGNKFSTKDYSGDFVGFAFIENIKVKNHNMNLSELLDSEVETYSNYLNGKVYKFEIFKNKTKIYSCGGFVDFNEMQIQAMIDASILSNEN